MRRSRSPSTLPDTSMTPEPKEVASMTKPVNSWSPSPGAMMEADQVCEGAAGVSGTVQQSVVPAAHSHAEG